MKLLTTITALLLSFCAFSQDYIEYRDFKFYQNGSEISFEEVTELTKEFGVAKASFRQGRRDFAAGQNISRARGRNLINGALSYSAGFCGIGCVAIGAYQLDGGLSDGDFHPASYITLFTLGAISAGFMTYYGSLLASKKKFRKRADKKFNKTTQKLNDAIQLGKSQ
jgi:hypothetical protein